MSRKLINIGESKIELRFKSQELVVTVEPGKTVSMTEPQFADLVSIPAFVNTEYHADGSIEENKEAQG